MNSPLHRLKQYLNKKKRVKWFWMCSLVREKYLNMIENVISAENTLTETSLRRQIRICCARNIHKNLILLQFDKCFDY